MIAQIVLTPWESKRLIAKGVTQLESVKKALKEGIIAVARSTTASYVVEELLGEKFDKERYASGLVLPDRLCLIGKTLLPELAFVKGKVQEVPTNEIVQKMGEGDIFVKSANALDFSFNAGILIGSSVGGTIGRSIGTIYARGIELLIPIGLEKLIPVPVEEVSMQIGISKVNYSTGMPVGLFPIRGTVITEMDAIELLAAVDTMPLAAGGILGAEGATIIQVSGEDDEVQKIIDLVKEIKGEPPLKVPTSECWDCDWPCPWKGADRPY